MCQPLSGGSAKHRGLSLSASTHVAGSYFNLEIAFCNNDNNDNTNDNSSNNNNNNILVLIIRQVAPPKCIHIYIYIYTYICIYIIYLSLDIFCKLSCFI